MTQPDATYRAALEEITRAMNILLNEVAGISLAGSADTVKPETFDRAKRAYDAATAALRRDMADFRAAAQRPFEVKT